MPVYSSQDQVRSGLPLGGIGTGKLELLPSGVFNAFTFQNNWSKPLSGHGDYTAVLGFHLGLFVESGSSSGFSKKAFFLQTTPIRDLPLVKNIRFEGIFPRATLSYEEPGLGVQVTLEAFSPWIPGDVKNSSLPAVFFTLKVKNLKDIPVSVGFLFIGRNVSGDWCVGRQNRITDGKKSLDLEFFNQDPSVRDEKQGALRFSFLKSGWKMSFIESWNAVTKNFSFRAADIALAGWDDFVKQAGLPNTKNSSRAESENQELCGAVEARHTVGPHGEKELYFNAAWHFPRHPSGHRYEKWFKNTSRTAEYALTHRNSLREAVANVERAVFSLPFPRWFNDALLTNLAPFFASSWYVKDGRFAFYEAPTVCPLMGTLDVGFYGSIPLAYFFPELEISQIAQFAQAQREDGYIPHDLGRNRLDLPSDGTTFYRWKDLNPKFILMVYRDALWSGDRSFLKRFYPKVKKALLWSLKTDRDGNGLPDHEGQDQTFDLWEFYGTNAYTSGLFLAALQASIRMAERVGDKGFAQRCRGWFAKGSVSFESELWNGKYFGGVCSLAQLNGQWYTDLLGLEPIADRKKVRKALGSILKINTGHSLFGMVNSAHPNGLLDTSNSHARNIWPGMNYAFVSLCLMEGFSLKVLLNEVHKIWDNVTRVQKSPWNQPDMIDSTTGKFLFGDFYYRNMALWSIPIGYAMKNTKTARTLRYLKSLSIKRKGPRV
ncbi:MAG: hypothetical protein HYZ87_04855 [Candidatus Omnitrophica bacterium]|nr:hypothetical protein [Candidatus Omnitrophota bacterium]